METLEDLVSYQKELDQEEEFLTKLILQIDEQINRLQVEQMELQSAVFKNSSMPQRDVNLKNEKVANETPQELVLSVPSNINRVLNIEEEEDEEDEDEDM